MRKSVCFCLVLLCVLLLYSCGIPIEVYLGSSEVKERILTRNPSINSEPEIIPWITELELDTSKILKIYPSNGILISYLSTNAPDRPKRNLENDANLLIFPNDEPLIVLNNLYNAIDKDFYSFFVEVNLNGDASFKFSLTYDDNYSWESDNEAIEDDIEYIHFYAQYYIEDQATGESDITEVRTYLGYHQY